MKKNSKIQIGDNAKISGDVFTGNKRQVIVGNEIQKNNILSNYNVNSINNSEELFKLLREIIQAMPNGPQKEVANSAVQGLEAQATSINDPNEEETKKWLEFLKQTSQDAFEVALETLKNPVAGISMVFQKIIKKASEENEKNKI